MDNIDQHFPQKRLDALITSARTFDRHNLRIDQLSPTAFGYLCEINPSLAYALQDGRDLKYHKDAAEGISYARSLEHIRPGLLDVLFPDLEGLKFVPLEAGVDPAKEIFTYRGQRKVGRAQLIKSYADDLPRAEVTGIESTQVIRGIGDSYAYTMQELRAAMSMGQPIDVKKAMAARYAIALSIDETIFYGNTEGGLPGLLTLANTTAFTVATGVAGSKLWRKKTPDEIVIDLHSWVNNVVKTTLGVHRPNAMLLPLAAYNIIATRRMGDGSNATVLSFFLSTSPYIQSVDPSYRLDAAFAAGVPGSTSPGWGGTANTSRGVVYEKNSERMALVMPVEFEQQPPFQRHFVTETACHARIGGVVIYYPGSVSYMDGVTDQND